MESFTPRSFISGRIPATRGNALQALTHAAASLLGVEQVALVHAQDNGHLWYLAAPASDFASHPGASTALAAALPGNDKHEGDGAYLLELSAGLQAVVVKQGDNLHSYVGTPAMAQRFIVLEGAQVTHPCAGPGIPWQFPTAIATHRNFRLNLALTVSGLVVAFAASAVWLWAAQSASDLDAQRTSWQQENQRAWQAALQGLEPPAYPKALAHLQQSIEQAIKEKGALQQFEHQGGRSQWTLKIGQRTVSGSAN